MFRISLGRVVRTDHIVDADRRGPLQTSEHLILGAARSQDALGRLTPMIGAATALDCASTGSEIGWTDPAGGARDLARRETKKGGLRDILETILTLGVFQVASSRILYPHPPVPGIRRLLSKPRTDGAFLAQTAAVPTPSRIPVIAWLRYT